MSEPNEGNNSKADVVAHDSAEFREVCAHYRHLETMRNQLLGFYFPELSWQSVPELATLKWSLIQLLEMESFPMFSDREGY